LSLAMLARLIGHFLDSRRAWREQIAQQA
jgi:hypothetical protein